MADNPQKTYYKRIANYIIEHIIGKGSFSQVHRGIDELTNQYVAIKITPKEMITKQPQLKHLIQSEVNILHQCNNENVVKLIDYIETNLSCYLIMEYCDQGDLRNYIKQKNHLSEKEGIYFLKQFLNGFKGLHEVNAIHRDFKSANVLKKDGILKIGDLGFGKQSETANTCLGTSIYMAPEVLKNKVYTNKADIWSLGVVYYEMLFGTFPYIGKNDKEILNLLEHQEIDYTKFNIKISDESKDLLRKIFVIEPEKRIEWTEIYNHELFYEKPIDEDYLNMGSIIKAYDIQDLKQNPEQVNSIMKKNTDFYKMLEQEKQEKVILEDEKIENNEEEKPPEDCDNNDQDNENLEVLGKLRLYAKNSLYIALDKKKEEICKEENYDSKHPFYIEMNDYIKKKQNDEILSQHIRTISSFYMHKRNIYSYIGKAIFNSLILQANNNDAHYANFILAKKIISLSELLVRSFANRQNYFELDFFEEFYDSKEGEDLKKFITDEYEYFVLFYNSICNDTKKVLIDDNVLNNDIVKHLDRHYRENFNSLYQQVLLDYYLSTFNKACKEENNPDSKIVIRLFKHCYEILDIIVLDEIFPYVLKDMKGNKIFFDFKKYHQIYEILSLDEIKKAIELKFENSLKNMTF